MLGVNCRFLGARIGGVQRFAREVTTRLLDESDVVLFAPRGGDVPPAWSGARIVRGTLNGHAWEQLELPYAAARTCEVLFGPANTAPVRAAVKQVLMLHDVFALTQPQWYGRTFAAGYRALIPAAAAGADVILTTSAHAARGICGTLAVDAARVRVVPQGLAPLDTPTSAAEVQRVCARLGVPVPYVLAPGFGDARKNTLFAEAVVEELGRRGAAVPALVLTGAAPVRVYGRVAKAHAQTLTPGHVSDEELRALYTGAAAVLCPSFDEGLGRAPLEALCCGAPSIVTAHAAAHEVLAATPAVRLPLDVRAWADALGSILDAGERVPASVGARLAREWSWDASARAVLDACHDAVAAAVPTGAVR